MSPRKKKKKDALPPDPHEAANPRAAEEAAFEAQVQDKSIAAGPLRKKLKDRGFVKGSRDEECADCKNWTKSLYQLNHPKVGGRDIEWCWWCGVSRSWRRPVGRERFQDNAFELNAFLS